MESTSVDRGWLLTVNSGSFTFLFYLNMLHSCMFYGNVLLLMCYILLSVQVEGAVTVQPFAEPVVGFEDYFLSQIPTNNTRNPWFVEYWEDYFKVRQLEGITHT